jgi:predicted Zn-ribbon and HTH transcriptional regulator
MRTHEYEQIRGVLTDAEEPLTASEILALLEANDTIDSAHRVATVLGRQARRGEVDVIVGRPYRYALER